MWQKLTDTLPRSGQSFLLEWDGNWQKATRWNDNIQLWWSGERHLIALSDVIDRYWMDVPLMPNSHRVWLDTVANK